MTDIWQHHRGVSIFTVSFTFPYPAPPSRVLSLVDAAGRGRLTPYQSDDPSPILPTYRGKEEKGKIVEDKKGESN